MAAMIFSIFAAQPLTIVGITGLISLFNYTIFDIVRRYEPSIYANFMCWTAIWAAVFHWIVAACNLCDYMRYVTDFSSESFGMYVGIIYLSECPVYLAAEVMLTSTSQRSGRARQRIQRSRPYSRLHELYDRHPLLPHCLLARTLGN